MRKTPKRLIFTLSAVFLLSFSLSARAYNQRTSTVSTTYSNSINFPSGRHLQIANGQISVLHRVDMTQGNLVNLPGQAICFSYYPDKPYFSAYGGPWDTPYGTWCGSRNDYCMSVVNAKIKDSRGSGNLGWVNVTAVKPGVSISSSNPAIVSCSGGCCTANSPGSTRLTAHINGTGARVWTLFQLRKDFDTCVYEMCHDLPSTILGYPRCAQGYPILFSGTDDPKSIDGDEGADCAKINVTDNGKYPNLPSTSVYWDITVQTPPPTLTLSAVPNPVAYNTASTLSWTVSNATWCWGKPWPVIGWKSSANGTYTESTGNLIAAKNYIMICGNAGPSTVTKSVTVGVNMPPPPTLTLSAVPNPVNYNTASTLTWTTVNATSCWATNGWTGWKAFAGGTESTGLLTAAKTYSLECWNAAGVSSGIKSVTVGVNPPPCVSNCSCASSTCVGDTCSDGCGGNCSGTMPNTCSSWGSSCSKDCGGGTQTKSCFCPSRTETQSCNAQPCSSGYREVTPW